MPKSSVTFLLCLVILCCHTVMAEQFLNLEDRLSGMEYEKMLTFRHLSIEFFDYFSNITMDNLLPPPQNRLPTTQDLMCLSELSYMLQSLSAGKLWAFRMVDSWGSIPSGMLYGNIRHLGNFDECIKIKKELTAGNYLKGKYCFAKLPVGKLLEFNNILDNIKISTAVCFPSSCTGDHMNTLFKQLFKKLLNVDYNSQLVNNDSCQTADHEPLDGLTIFTIVIFSVLCGLMVLATLYDYFLCDDQTKLPRAIKAFSARFNSRAVFQFVDSKSNPNVIDCLHGIRCLSLIWVVFGHDYIPGLIGPNQNMIHAYKWSEQPFAMLIIHAVYAVDTFFFLSGLLLVLITLRVLERQKGKLNVPLMYLHRYLRLTPVLALAILAYWKLLPHMGDGPLWMSLQHEKYGLCSNNWYYSILYVQNYATDNICLSHTWYLAVDMQLYIISPILLFALYKWGKKAVAGIVVLLLLLAACLFSMMVIKHYSLQYKGNPPSNSEKKIYVSTETRASPWLIGLLFGYFLHINRGKTFTLSPLKVWLGWIISLAFFFTSLFALYPATKWSVPALSHVGEAFYLTLTRIAWPLGLCWVVFACMQGYGGLANSFLSSPMWQPLSKLSYCAYIWHIFILNINIRRTRTNTYFSNYDVMLRFWADFALAVMLAFLIYIVVEAPLSGLQNMLLPERRDKTASSVKPSSTRTTEEPMVIRGDVADTAVDEKEKTEVIETKSEHL